MANKIFRVTAPHKKKASLPVLVKLHGTTHRISEQDSDPGVTVAIGGTYQIH